MVARHGHGRGRARGMRRAALLVAAAGLVALAGLPSAAAAPVITSPDTAGFVGLHTSLALNAQGHPVVSYWDGTNGDLKVLVCGDPTCTSGNSITAPDTAGNVGLFTSLALNAQGHPVVSYYDGTNGDLKVLVCGNPTCTSGNTIVTADAAGIVGWDTSVAVDAQGHPVVSYYDSTNGDLKVLVCGNPTCTGGNTITAPDTAGNVGQRTAVALNGQGHPVVSYLDNSNGDLKVLVCGNPTCTSGNSITAPDTVGVVGWYSSLKLDAQGHPVVSYWDGTNDDLKVLVCGNPTCTSGNSITAPDTAGNVGQYTSLALDPCGNPVVSYVDFTNGDLKVYVADTCVPPINPPTIQFIPEKLLPDGQWVPYGGEWHSGIVRVRVVCTAGDHPIAYDSTPARFWFELDGTFTVPVNAVEGWRCRDAAGNIAAWGPSSPIVVRVDRRAPNCTVTPSPASFSRNIPWQTVNISLSPGAGPSGVDAIWLHAISGKATDRQNWAFGTEDYSGQLKGGGVRQIYTITYAVRDNAGNVGYCSATVKSN